MAVDIQLKRDAGYLRATFTGTVRLAECLEALRQVVEVTASSGSCPILLDVRATRCDLLNDDITLLMGDLSAQRPVLPGKIAVVYSEAVQGDIVKSFELSAWIYDLRVRAFSNDAGAVQWLVNSTVTESS